MYSHLESMKVGANIFMTYIRERPQDHAYTLVPTWGLGVFAGFLTSED